MDELTLRQSVIIAIFPDLQFEDSKLQETWSIMFFMEKLGCSLKYSQV